MTELSGPGGAEWDHRLGAWPGANLLQSHGWGEVQAGAGWETVRLQVETPSGCLPISAQVGRSWLPGFTRIYVPRGPVCAAGDLAAFSAAAHALLALGRDRRSLALEVEVPWGEGEVPPQHPWLGWEPVPPRQPRATLVVDLRCPPEALMAQFHAKARYNIRLAERRGVTVSASGDLAPLDLCLRATEARQRIHLPRRSHLEAVRRELGESLRVLVARVEGEPVAALMMASFAGSGVYLYGGATGAHRQLMPNQLLQWRAMLEARAMGCSGYDLWGVPETEEPSHPWHGLAQFKRGFGGTEIRYAGSRSLALRPGGRAALALADSLRHRVRTRGRR